MTKKIKKHPPIPEDRLAKYKDLWENSRSRDGVAPEVRAHLERVKTMGGGQGIEFLSNLNKDYLGAFMSPFSRDIEDADIVVIGLPFEKSAPMNASHKYGPKVLREISKNFMGTTEPWIDGKFDVPFDWARIIDYGNIDTYGCFDLSAEVEVAREHYKKIVLDNGCSTLMWGGDHTVSIVPLNCPSNALNAAPGSAPIVTGLPVIASCVAGSRYISYSADAAAGSTTDC